MVPHDIQTVLQQLSAIAGEWVQTGIVPSIERDLALEKLRRLYEELLTGSSEPIPYENEPGVSDVEPVSINLDEVLSVGLSAEDGQEAPFVSVPEPVAASLSVEAVEHEPAVASEPERVVAGSVSGSDPEPSAESMIGDAVGTADDSSSATETVREATPLTERVGNLLSRESVTEPTDAACAAEVANVRSGPAPRGKSESGSQAVIPSLFGPEDQEALRRHRHKQQILMSLYDMPESVPSNPMKTGSDVRPDDGDDSPVLRAEADGVATVGHSVDPSNRAESVVRNGTPDREPDTVLSHRSSEEPDSGSQALHPAEKIAIREVDEKSPEKIGIAAAMDDVALEGVSGESVGAEPESAAAITATESGAKEPPATADLLQPAESGSVLSVSRSESDDDTTGSVLGDVINHDVRTLGDELSASTRSMASEIARHEPVKDLRKAIGINDRFLMIRDLFGGDAEAYDAAIAALNAFGDLDECLIHIAEHYAWNPNSDGAKLLMELIERKLA